jgi:hypothetical protein
MKKLAIVDMQGKVTGYTSVPADQIEANRAIRLEHDLIEELPPSNFHTWDGTKWNPPPDDHDLTVAKQKKLASLKTWRHVEEHKGFTWNGNLFESDAESRTSITLAVLVGGQRTWHTADNKRVSLNADEVKAFGTALSNFMDGIHFKYQDYKKQLDNCKTLQQLEDCKALHFMPYVSLLD